MAEGAGPEDDARRLRLSGEIDIARVEGILTEAAGCLQTEPSLLEIDMSAVTFIDSSGLGALVRIRNDAERRGARVVLVNLPDSIRRLLEITGLHHVLEMDPSEWSRQ